VTPAEMAAITTGNFRRLFTKAQLGQGAGDAAA